MPDSSRTADAIVQMAALSLRFAKVNRATLHEDGERPESDTDHTFMLSLVACALAAEHYTNLDIGLVAQYAITHDFVEVYAGDTPTLGIGESGKHEKEERESLARERIDRETRESAPWIGKTIRAYESLSVPEARFIKVLDKLLPKAVAILNGGAQFRKMGKDRSNLKADHEAQHADLTKKFGTEFPLLLQVLQELMERSQKTI